MASRSFCLIGLLLLGDTGRSTAQHGTDTRAAYSPEAFDRPLVPLANCIGVRSTLKRDLAPGSGCGPCPANIYGEPIPSSCSAHIGRQCRVPCDRELKVK